MDTDKSSTRRINTLSFKTGGLSENENFSLSFIHICFNELPLCEPSNKKRY